MCYHKFHCSNIPLSNYQIKCQGQIKSQYYCENFYCSQINLFICKFQDCLCKRQHKLCPRRNLQQTIKKVEQKIVGSKKINQLIIERIQSLIKELISLNSTLIQAIQKKIKYSNLSNIQYEFFKIIQNKSLQLSSDKKKYVFSQLYKTAMKPFNFEQNETLNIFDSISRQIQRIFSQAKLNIDTISHSINVFNKKIEQQFSFKNMCAYNRQKLQQHEWKKKEEISKNQQKVKINDLITKSLLPKLFSQKVSSIKSLYRGTDYNFDIKKFYQICENESNLFIVCQGEDSNKVVGGYTSLKFKPTGKIDYLGQEWVKDYNKDSFIFTWTKNSGYDKNFRKFIVIKGRDAIKRCQQRSRIQFGFEEFLITCQQGKAQCNFQISGTNYYKPKQYIVPSQLRNFPIKQLLVIKIQWDDPINTQQIQNNNMLKNRNILRLIQKLDNKKLRQIQQIQQEKITIQQIKYLQLEERKQIGLFKKQSKSTANTRCYDNCNNEGITIQQGKIDDEEEVNVQKQQIFNED